MNAERFISQRSAAVDASGIRRVFELGARLENPINLSIGQPDYDVPEPIKAAAIDAIVTGRNRYTVTQGIPALREQLLAELKRELDWDPGLLVTSGVSGGILLSLMATINPGDEVLLSDPYFVIYKHAVRLIGGVPVFVDTYPDFTLHPERIEAAITPHSKLLVIASPSNPTGVVLGESDLRAAAELAERHDLLIVADEIYSSLLYDGACSSVVRFAPDRTLLLRGFSKSFGMTGWRLGYAAGPSRIVEEMTKLQQYTFVCAPSIAQYAALAADPALVAGHVDDYRRKRDHVHQRIGRAYEVVRPRGGFYFFPRIPAGFENATRFVESAAERGLLIIPGEVFSERNTHFRLSYAAPDEVLARGCDVLIELAEGKRG